MHYLGHHPDGSSVQQHSAGTHYPLVLRFRESGHGDTEYWFATEVINSTGRVLHTSWTYENARNARIDTIGRAREWAELRAANDRDAKLHSDLH